MNTLQQRTEICISIGHILLAGRKVGDNKAHVRVEDSYPRANASLVALTSTTSTRCWWSQTNTHFVSFVLPRCTASKLTKNETSIDTVFMLDDRALQSAHVKVEDSSPEANAPLFP